MFIAIILFFLRISYDRNTHGISCQFFFGRASIETAQLAYTNVCAIINFIIIITLVHSFILSSILQLLPDMFLFFFLYICKEACRMLYSGSCYGCCYLQLILFLLIGLMSKKFVCWMQYWRGFFLLYVIFCYLYKLNRLVGMFWYGYGDKK